MYALFSSFFFSFFLSEPELEVIHVQLAERGLSLLPSRNSKVFFHSPFFPSLESLKTMKETE